MGQKISKWDVIYEWSRLVDPERRPRRDEAAEDDSEAREQAEAASEMFHLVNGFNLILGSCDPSRGKSSSGVQYQLPSLCTESLRFVADCLSLSRLVIGLYQQVRIKPAGLENNNANMLLSEMSFYYRRRSRKVYRCLESSSSSSSLIKP